MSMNLDSVKWSFPSVYLILILSPQHAEPTVDGCWPNALQEQYRLCQENLPQRRLRGIL